MENLNVGIIIPDRNDRPKFLENCLRMIHAQTIQPTIIEVVNDTPISDACDITMRYRLGYERLMGKNLDCILFIENDDWYSTNYIETMVKKWVELGRPQLFGTQYTIYYHIGVRGYFQFDHFRRASAMNTLIVPDLEIDWGNDSNPYTDSHLWFLAKTNKSTLKGLTFMPMNVISIGIKHGFGKTGGAFHTDKLEHMDKESFKFYTNYES